jgi:hypothetical protein
MMENIPSNKNFVGKKSKAKDKFEKRIERSLEALAYSISHPGVIIFWALIQQPWKHTHGGRMVHL